MADDGKILVGQLKLDITQLGSDVTAVNKLLADIGKDAKSNVDMLSRLYSDLAKNIAKVAEAESKKDDDTQSKKIRELATAYKQLTQAQREQVKAYKSGDGEQKAWWNARVTGIQNTIKALEKQINVEKLSANQKDRYNVLLKQSENSMSSFAAQIDKLNAQMNKHNKEADISDSQLKKVTAAYRQLTQAQREQVKAAKQRDDTGMKYWETQITAANNEITLIREQIDSLNLEEDVREQILRIIQQAISAQNEFNDKTDKAKQFANNLEQQFSKVLNVVKMVAGISLAKMWHDALNYAKEQDKALTDIAIVTQKPVESVRQLGVEYRKIASELNVTSTSIAQAASTIYRQGVTGDSEVKGIVEGATKFGAVSELSTDEAISVMTASMQNFKTETETTAQVVERIGDAWSYMGDAVATSGADIADAMSKASASVNSVGLGFEKASAYAAVMLARTQQTGQVIGTQLNSLVARYAKITSTGFEKVAVDDEGEALSFNDVSRALKEAGIEIYDAATGIFMPMGEMMDRLAKKWDTLDIATQKYIATAVGGTRGLNYFLTLMKDYDLALELTDEAIANRGIVNEKYLQWLQGVEAAQNDLANSWENFYSILSADFLTDAYHNIAGIVDVFTEGTKAMNGWNLKIPMIIAGLFGLAGAIVKIDKLWTAFKAKDAAGVMASGGVTALIAIAGTALTLFGALISAHENVTERLARQNEEISELESKAGSYEAIITELDELQKKEKLTADEQERFRALVVEMSELSPDIQAAYGMQAEGLTGVAEAAKIATEKLNEYNAAIDATNYLALTDRIIAYNKKAKELFGDQRADIYGLKEYASISGDDAIFNLGMIPDYIDKYSNIMLTSESDLETLQKGIANLNEIIALPEQQALDPNDQDDNVIKRLVENEYSRITALITVLESKIRELHSELQGVITSALSDPTYSGMFRENMGLRQSILNAFIGADWQNEDANIISGYANDVAKYFLDAFKNGMDIQTMVEDSNPIIGSLVQDLASGKIDSDEIGNAMDNIFNILDGELLDRAESISGESHAPASLRKAASIYMSAAYKAIGELSEMQGTEELQQAIRNGKFGANILDMLGDALSRAGTDDEKKAILDKFFNSTPTEFEDWKVAVYPEIVPDENATQESAEKAISKVEEWINAAQKKRYNAQMEGSLYSLQLMQSKQVLSKADGQTSFVSFIDNMYANNQELAEGFLAMYPGLQLVYKGSLDAAQGLELLATYTSDAKDAVEEFNEMKKKISEAAEEHALNTENEIAAQDKYIDQLKEIKIAGIKAFAITNDQTKATSAMLDVMVQMGVENEALVKGMLDMHDVLYKLAQDEITYAEAMDAVNKAIAYTEKLPTPKADQTTIKISQLMEDAASSDYNANLRANEAAANRFVEELEILEGVLHDPDGAEEFKKVLADMESETRDAMIAENEWINSIINGNLTIEEAIALLREMIAQKRILNELDVGSLDNEVERFGMSGTEIVGARNQVDEVQKFIDQTLYGNDEFEMLDFFEAFPEAMATVNTEGEALSYLQNRLEELNKVYGEVLKVLGLTTDATEEYNKAIREAIAPIDETERIMEKLAKKNQLTADEVKQLADEYPDLKKEIKEFTDTGKGADKLLNELNKRYRDNSVREFSKNIGSALSAIDDAKEGTVAYEEAMINLGNLFTNNQWSSMDALTFAEQNLNSIRAAAEGSVEAFHALQNAAWINIVGTADIDFSAATNGLALVGDQAIAVGNMMAAVGMGTVEYIPLNSEVDTLVETANGFSVVKQTLSGLQAVWKPSAKNPFAKSGYESTSPKKSGGGGGGGGNTSVSKNTESMLGNMERKHESYDNRLKIAELKKEYHDIRGEIQGVIGYTKIESDIIKEQNKTLEENIASLEAEMKAKEAIIAKNKSTSKAYKQAEVDLEELNKAHKEYSEKLLENTNRLEEIKEELEEFNEEARQTVISVQDLIRETLEGYDDLQRNMLDGTVDLEDTILEVITARYEKEQELAIETAEKKIETIQEEIDAIDKLIEERRKLIEEEEEAIEVAELEAKIARISADPTRRKEMLKLQDELNEKRKEMAWDAYEEEMNAQKDSLEDQITSLEDYIEYVNEYYEELFNNPVKLIEEMKGVISKTDAEIIEWLTVNHEEYSKYTEAKRKQAEEDWQAMIDQMKGITETYHEEIDALMKLTDEEIIAWLKKYNVEFQNATEEQQESFIHSWKNTLEDWRNAYKNVAASVSGYNYVSGSGSGSGSGGGGGSGGSGSGNSTSASGSNNFSNGGLNPSFGTPDQVAQTVYKGTATVNYTKGNVKYAITKIAQSTVSKADAILNARNQALAAVPTGATVTGSKAYKLGGLATETGPAWLDGTKSKPERVLSAYQTQLFEDMIKTLHEIRTINVGGIMNAKAPDINNGAGGFNIESIQVIVENLDTDADYEEMAERVGEKLKEQIMRGMAIGGLTI